jgi:TonB family protein
MQSDGGFWRNVAMIGVMHVAVLAAVIRWSGAPAKAPASNILWMDGGAALQETSIALVSQTPTPSSPIVEPPLAAEPEEQAEPPKREESQINLPTATPQLKPITTPKATPKPTPKAPPKPTPKKIILAKAASTPSPAKPSATPLLKKAPNGSSPAEASPAPTVATDVAGAIAAAAKTGTAPTVGISGTGSGGTATRGVGAGAASQFGWYAHMLHDRFFSQWAQPTSVVRSGAKMSTLVKLRIEKDGAVSRFTILRPSGNVVVDESIAAMAKRVTRVDPLPPGLGDAFYEVNINFELNSDQ